MDPKYTALIRPQLQGGPGGPSLPTHRPCDSNRSSRLVGPTSITLLKIINVTCSTFLLQNHFFFFNKKKVGTKLKHLFKKNGHSSLSFHHLSLITQFLSFITHHLKYIIPFGTITQYFSTVCGPHTCTLYSFYLFFFFSSTPNPNSPNPVRKKKRGRIEDRTSEKKGRRRPNPREERKKKSQRSKGAAMDPSMGV